METIPLSLSIAALGVALFALVLVISLWGKVLDAVLVWNQSYAPVPDEAEKCRTRQCSYYQHYLAYGPAELTHEGFHAAEKKCEAIQLQIQRYLDEDRPPPQHLVKVAESWEQRVRA